MKLHQFWHHFRSTLDAFLMANLQTTKAACHDDIGQAIRGQLPTTPLGALFLQHFWRAILFTALILGKCQEPPKADKNQKLTNADHQSTNYNLLSLKLGPPQRTLPTIRGRRCSRRMAHSDISKHAKHVNCVRRFDIFLILYDCYYITILLYYYNLIIIIIICITILRYWSQHLAVRKSLDRAYSNPAVNLLAAIALRRGRKAFCFLGSRS